MRNIVSSAIALSAVCRPKLLKSATWPWRSRMIVRRAVSPSATDCFIRASSASRPAFVTPSVVGSATADAGHAAARPGAGVCACAVMVTAARAASQTVRRGAVFTAFLQVVDGTGGLGGRIGGTHSSVQGIVREKPIMKHFIVAAAPRLIGPVGLAAQQTGTVDQQNASATHILPEDLRARANGGAHHAANRPRQML